MAYIRWNTRLPSGETSRSFVIGDPAGLMNFAPNTERIPRPELVELFKTKTYPEITAIVKQRLGLNDEETAWVCERLFEEHGNGEWECAN